jgi:hypothetical protein
MNKNYMCGSKQVDGFPDLGFQGKSRCICVIEFFFVLFFSESVCALN